MSMTPTTLKAATGITLPTAIRITAIAQVPCTEIQSPKSMDHRPIRMDLATELRIIPMVLSNSGEEDTTHLHVHLHPAICIIQ